MEPIALDLDGADCTKALEEHVETVKNRQCHAEFHLQLVVHKEVQRTRHACVHQRGTQRSNQHATLATHLVNEWSNEKQTDRIRGGTGTGDETELCFGHQRTKRNRRHGQVVTPHVQK